MCTCAWAWVWAWACASLSSSFSDSFHVPSCVSEALPLLVGVQAPLPPPCLFRVDANE